MRHIITVIQVAFLLGLPLTAIAMPGTDAVVAARTVGYLAVALSIAIPLLLWFLGHKMWSPKSKIQYALRATLWPPIIFSYQLGGPMARMLLGIESAYARSLLDTFVGVVMMSILPMALAFSIGWRIGKKKFQNLPPQDT